MFRIIVEASLSAYYAKSMARKEITLAVVLDHIKGLSTSVHILERRFNSMETRMDSFEKKMDEGFTKVWRRFDWVDAALDNIDTRLDEIELQHLPQRVAKLEKKVFASVDS